MHALKKQLLGFFTVIALLPLCAVAQTITIQSPKQGDVYEQTDLVTVQAQISGIGAETLYLYVGCSTNGGITWAGHIFQGKITNGSIAIQYRLKNQGDSTYLVSRTLDDRPMSTQLQPTQQTRFRLRLTDSQFGENDGTVFANAMTGDFTVRPVSITLQTPSQGQYYKVNDILPIRWK